MGSPSDFSITPRLGGSGMKSSLFELMPSISSTSSVLSPIIWIITVRVEHHKLVSPSGGGVVCIRYNDKDHDYSIPTNN